MYLHLFNMIGTQLMNAVTHSSLRKLSKAVTIPMAIDAFRFVQRQIVEYTHGSELNPWNDADMWNAYRHHIKVKTRTRAMEHYMQIDNPELQQHIRRIDISNALNQNGNGVYDCSKIDNSYCEIKPKCVVLNMDTFQFEQPTFQVPIDYTGFSTIYYAFPPHVHLYDQLTKEEQRMTSVYNSKHAYILFANLVDQLSSRVEPRKPLVRVSNGDKFETIYTKIGDHNRKYIQNQLYAYHPRNEKDEQAIHKLLELISRRDFLVELQNEQNWTYKKLAY